MAPRALLQTALEAILGSNRVYFQPPENLKMSYPCIVYERDSEEVIYADNHPYHGTKRYSVTVIDRDPDSLIPDRVSKLPMCRFSTHFKTDNLNHDSYNIYH